LLMTPAIWGSPLSRLKLAAELRADVLQGQSKASPDSYDMFADRWLALIKQPFLSDLQYFESPAFESYLDDQIVTYENAHLDGWQMPTIIGLLASVFTVIGIGTLLQKWTINESMPFIFWIIGVVLTTGITIPLAWQRYYLLWSLAACLLAGIGFGKLLSFIDNIAPRRADILFRGTFTRI